MKKKASSPGKAKYRVMIALDAAEKATVDRWAAESSVSLANAIRLRCGFQPMKPGPKAQ